ncbi:hypothetical protein Q4485_10980 [Granulosicoccaceae sp. 1_MG-2023]|nr:hypothetical protein [Granulosicoccaceae sp. 1_MG-2023]
MQKKTAQKIIPLPVRPLPRELAYAAVLDIDDREVEITEEMISKACESMAQEEIFPLCRMAS